MERQGGVILARTVLLREFLQNCINFPAPVFAFPVYLQVTLGQQNLQEEHHFSGAGSFYFTTAEACQWNQRMPGKVGSHESQGNYALNNFFCVLQTLVHLGMSLLQPVWYLSKQQPCALVQRGYF